MQFQRGVVPAKRLIAIALGLTVVGGGAYFVVQQKFIDGIQIDTPTSAPKYTPVQPVQNTPSTAEPVAQVATTEVEFWVVTIDHTPLGCASCKIDTSLVNRSVLPPAETPETYVKKPYVTKVVPFRIQAPVGIKINESKVSSTDSSIFFIVTKDQNGGESAYILNIQQKTLTKLFSSAEHPDFKLASIGNVSPDDTALRFHFAACDGCDGGIIAGAVYNIPKKVYKNIGASPLFRWTADGSFEYKSAPSGCEAYFANPLRDTQGMPCDEKLAAASWIQGNW